MANITVAQARTEFLQRKKDVSDIDAIAGTFLKWCNYVNRYLYRELTNIMPEGFIKSQTYTVSAGTTTYALPSDFQDIIPQGTGMYLVVNGLQTDTKLPMSSFGNQSMGMYLTGTLGASTSIVMTPTPTDTKVWTLRYIPLLADLSAEASEFLLPARYSEHLMNVLDNCYDIWDSDNNDEIFNNSRVIASIQELISLINPVSQAYLLPSFMDVY